MFIIGIAGKMGSGKDYIASKYIIPYVENILKHKILQLSLADQIKVNVMTKLNKSFDEVYINKTDETRCLLQREGTELGRDLLGDDIWIKYLSNWIKVFKNRGIDTIILADLRFKNEIDWIKSQNGLVIKVVASKRNNQRLINECNNNIEIFNKLKNHISECDLDDLNESNFDFIIKNDPEDQNQDFSKLYDLIKNRF
jgi:phosphomevalonate kinase